MNFRKTPVIFILLSWFIINLLQAYFTELTGDEAYYVTFAQHLDWGFFDHPPMVAVFIYLGSFLFDGELGVRILNVITSTLTLGILASFLPFNTSRKNICLFAALAFSLTMFSAYGFLTAPDVPLIFFTSLFIWVIKRYLHQPDWKYVLPLALSMAAMLYSKYHGIIFILLFVIANLHLFKKPSFYAAALLGIAFFFPHLWWQYEQGFPSLFYHTSVHSVDNWQWKFVFEYPLHQLLALGPLVAIPIFIAMYKFKASNSFERTLLFFFWGVLVFFFLMAFKSHVEPHWTVLMALPVLILVPAYYLEHPPSKWVTRLVFGNAALLLLVRLVMMFPAIPEPNFHGSEKWAKAIVQHSEGQPVVFYGSYQYASLFEFYTGKKSNSYNPHYYHATQFDRWLKENELRHEKVLFVSKQRISKQSDSLETTKGRFYSYWIADYYSLQNLGIAIIEKETKVNAGENFTLTVSISNPYDFPVDLHDKKRTINFSYISTSENGIQTFLRPTLVSKTATIPALKTKPIELAFSALEKGKHQLFLIQSSIAHPLGMRSESVIIISE